MTKIDELVVEVRADLKKLNAGYRTLERNSKRTSDKIDKGFASADKSINRTRLTTGRLKGALISLGAIQAGRLAARNFLEFDDALTKIISLVGVSKNQVKSWRQDILDLGPANQT